MAPHPADERDAVLKRRKEVTEAVTQTFGEHGGCITSVPGSMQVVIECRPATKAALVEDLRSRGFDTVALGDISRIDPCGLIEEIPDRVNGQDIIIKRHHAAFVERSVFCLYISDKPAAPSPVRKVS
jgi:hypothetical protein